MYTNAVFTQPLKIIQGFAHEDIGLALIDSEFAFMDGMCCLYRSPYGCGFLPAEIGVFPMYFGGLYPNLDAQEAHKPLMQYISVLSIYLGG